MRTPQIRDFMTSAPHSIGKEQTLASAHRLMRRHRVRHLPVLSAGKLVGMLSLRDLYFVETLDNLQPEEILVADAMTPDPFTTSGLAPVTEVAQEMAVKGYGAAVVMEGRQVAGVFTTTDALRALAAVCGELEHPVPQQSAAAH